MIGLCSRSNCPLKSRVRNI